MANRSKRDGARVIMAYALGKEIFFIFGFGKNEKDNINQSEYKALYIFGNNLLNATTQEITHLKKLGEIIEFGDEEHDKI